MALNINAKGNAADTGTPVTPAPTKSAMPDLVSKVRAPSQQGYSQNGPANPSSIAPGTQLLSPMAQVLKEAQDDGEHALDAIIAHGTRGAPTWETRPVSDKGYPPAHGMKSRASDDGSPGGK